MKNKQAIDAINKFIEWGKSYRDYVKSPDNKQMPTMEGQPTETELLNAHLKAIECLGKKPLTESQLLEIILRHAENTEFSTSNPIPLIFAIVRDVEKEHGITD
jgi:hypothetical protein